MPSRDLLGRNAFPPEIHGAGRDAMARYARELGGKRLGESREAGPQYPAAAPALRGRGSRRWTRFGRGGEDESARRCQQSESPRPGIPPCSRG